MGEPSLWNMIAVLHEEGSGSYVSTPHGRAVPLEPDNITYGIPSDYEFQPLMGEPSLWNFGVVVNVATR